MQRGVGLVVVLAALALIGAWLVVELPDRSNVAVDVTPITRVASEPVAAAPPSPASATTDEVARALDVATTTEKRDAAPSALVTGVITTALGDAVPAARIRLIPDGWTLARDGHIELANPVLRTWSVPRVDLGVPPWNQHATTTTDTDGRFELETNTLDDAWREPLSESYYDVPVIVVDAQGFATRIVALDPAGLELQVVLEHESQLIGRGLWSDATPIVGAVVEATPMDVSAPFSSSRAHMIRSARTATIGTSGDYLLGALEAGSYDLTLSRAGGVLARERVSVGVGETVVTDLSIARGPVLAIDVVSESQPVAGAFVGIATPAIFSALQHRWGVRRGRTVSTGFQLRRLEPWLRESDEPTRDLLLARGTTDARGHCRFELPHGTTACEIAVLSADHVAVLRPHDVASGTSALTIELASCSSETFSVVDAATREPVDGVHCTAILAVDRRFGEIVELDVSPLGAGVFRLAGRNGEAAHVEIRHDGFVAQYGEIVGERDTHVLEWHPITPSVVAGRVVLAGGAVGVDASVALRRVDDNVAVETLEIATQADGRFRFESVMPGEHELWVLHADHVPLSRNVLVTPGTNDIGTLHLDAGAVIEVVDCLVRSSLEIGIDVDVDGTWKSFYSAQTNTRGRAQIERLAPGRYRVRVDGRVDMVHDIAAGEHVLVEAGCEDPVRLVATVVGTSGAALTLVGWAADGEQLIDAPLHGDIFEAELRYTPTLNLRVLDEQHQALVSSVVGDLTPGGVRAVTLELGRESLEFIVTEEAAALGPFEVRIEDADITRSLLVESHGLTFLHLLPARPLHVSVHSKGGRSALITLDPHDVTRVTISAAPGGEMFTLGAE